ncbi:MAG: cysteine desulfurase [Candidatus Neomarinimicrobiota bacterium]|nr:cysteine desulfurase [Candidatus Neomarinimicrobiota bacterium]
MMETATLESSVTQAPPLDVKHIRSDFPIFRNRSAENPFTYLDSAATSQTPKQVFEAVEAYYTHYNANVHRSIYSAGEEATEAYELARRKVGNFLNADDSYAVVFTRGTTEAINLVAYGWGRHNLKKGDEILLTEMEHHSNLVPWQLAAKQTGASLRFIPFGENGTLEKIEACFSEKTKIVSVIHQSNVFGTVNDIRQIVSLAKAVGAVTLIDAAQSVPHLPVEVTDLDCDFLAFSGHKMLGPTGVGVLCGKTELLQQMEPFLTGGEMIRTVSLEASTWNDIPWKFEAGTPNIAQAIGLGAAVDYLSEIGMDAVHQYEKVLTEYALRKLGEMDEVTIYGKPPERGGVVAFNVDSVHPHDLSQLLDRDGVAVRAGHHCAQPIMDKLNVSATARASFYLYNDYEDVDRLAKSIKRSLEFLT